MFLKKIINWFIHQDIRILRKDLDDTIKNQIRFERQLKALQALDVGFRERGKIIIIARICGQDIVRIVDIKPEMPIEHYKELVHYIKDQYGASLRWVDSPFPMMSQELKEVGE